MSINKVLSEHSHAFLKKMSMAAFAKSSSFNDIIWPAKPKMCTVWPLTENVC